MQETRLDFPITPATPADLICTSPSSASGTALCLIAGYEGTGWRVDIGGNFRTSPDVANNLIRYCPAGSVVFPTGKVDDDAGGDWWKIKFDNVEGWFWNPGYKMSAR
jgi:hypothetical protein